MIKIFLRQIGTGGFSRVVEMPAVPRIGDSIEFGRDDTEETFEIHQVVWTPEAEEFDVYVVMQ